MLDFNSAAVFYYRNSVFSVNEIKYSQAALASEEEPGKQDGPEEDPDPLRAAQVGAERQKRYL